MNDEQFLAERFEADRTHLRSVAQRMLGSTAEADDAVQEAWIRLSRTDTSDVQNLTGWLTTVVSRVCLDRLRSRSSRREDLQGIHVPDPVIGHPDDGDPANQAALADSVGLAMSVVLDTLPPAERLAFVLHDLFGMPFDEIAPIVERTPAAARQLASRGRNRVRGGAVRDVDPERHRAVVTAFLAASQAGDFDALLELLDPDVVLRADFGAAGPSQLVRGAASVVAQAKSFARLSHTAHLALVNGLAGAVNTQDGGLFSVLDFTIVGGRIVAIDILADPERLARVDVSALDH